MTISNPLILLPVSEDDSLQDLYDEKLFEFKQFFSRQLPTTKLFLAKLKKLKQFSLAFEMLGGVESDLECFPSVSDSYKDLEIKDVVSLFQKESSELKFKMNSCKSYSAIDNVAMQMIDNYRLYAECWYLDEVPEDQNIKLSEELDAMSLLEGVINFNKLGKTTFKELNAMTMDNVLYKEAIRLSLWLNFEKNV